MYAADKNALLCDMAETYKIFDLQALPVSTLAVLACGLGADSRIRRKMAGAKAPMHITLLACVADRLGTLVWMQSEDGQKGRNRPPSILRALLGQAAEEEPAGFDSPEAFMAARAEIIGE